MVGIRRAGWNPRILLVLLLTVSLVWGLVSPILSCPLRADTPRVRIGRVVHSGVQAWRDGGFVGTYVGEGGGIQATEKQAPALALRDEQSTGTYTSPRIRAPWPFVALGLVCVIHTPGGSSISFEARTSADGRAWDDWRPLSLSTEESRAGAPQSTDLIFVPLSRYAQYRLTFHADETGATPSVETVNLTFIDSRAGPTAAELAAASRAMEVTGAPRIISRSSWGADETWMTWPPEYRPVQKAIVHHTVTDEGGADPAWVVRAIYAYHALPESQGGHGWGDIGYNFLVDHLGNIYEGRYGGDNVVGGHDFQYNWGSVGVALIGDFQEHDIPTPMLNSLTDLLAWKCAAHSLDPLGSGYFIDRNLPNILAHRDTNGTTPVGTACPGERAYAMMSTIRSQSKAKLPPPAVHITSPQEEQKVRSVVPVTFSIPGEATIIQVDYHLDGQEVYSADSAPFTWKWNTVGVSDGTHTLRIVAYTASGQTEGSVRVVVDNTPPDGWAAVSPWSNSTHVSFQLGDYGSATQVQFSNGWAWEGESLLRQTGKVVSDPAASGSQALYRQGSSGLDKWWYGPYTCDLPGPGEYQVYFRVKTPDRTLQSQVAILDVADDAGRTIYTQRPLNIEDFARNNAYEEFSLNLIYPEDVTTCRNQKHDDDLEFRTHFRDQGDLYLDRVAVFGAPRALSPYLYWDVRPGDGPQDVTVRFLDEAGNTKDYPVAVRVDSTVPQWSDIQPRTAWVQDSLSGLDPNTAAWSASSDGGHTWGAWQPLSLAVTSGATEAVEFVAPDEAGDVVRFRVQDLAGNISVTVPDELRMPLILKLD